MIDLKEAGSRKTQELDPRNMAVEIVMFDENDRPSRPSRVHVADYLSPLNKIGFGAASRQG